MRNQAKSRRRGKKKKEKTPSFVAEIPLRTTAEQERILSIRLDAARQIYNCCLGESLRRLDLMRESRDWQQARALKKGNQRSQLFEATRQRLGFSSVAIQKFAEQSRDACWIGRHLGSHDTQTTSLRAFRAVEQYAFGKRGRLRFKSKNRLHSVEGKEDAVVRFRWQDGHAVVLWAGLVLEMMLDPRDPTAGSRTRSVVRPSTCASCVAPWVAAGAGIRSWCSKD